MMPGSLAFVTVRHRLPGELTSMNTKIPVFCMCFVLLPTGLCAQESGTDWSGFYAGIYGGYALEGAHSTHEASEIVGQSQTLPGGGVLYLYSLQLDDQRSRMEAPVAGGRIGYNLQTGAFVFGLEGSLEGGSLTRYERHSTAVDAAITPPAPPLDVDGTIYSDALFTRGLTGTLTARAGWTWDGWLAYAKGGIVLADVTSSATQQTDVTNYDEYLDRASGVAPPDFSVSEQGLSVASTIGIGVETMITEHLSAGIEYDYTRFPGSSLTAPQEDLNAFLEQPTDLHTVKAGLNLHF
jgi:opacity protein-like surface antigen